MNLDSSGQVKIHTYLDHHKICVIPSSIKELMENFIYSAFKFFNSIALLQCKPLPPSTKYADISKF